VFCGIALSTPLLAIYAFDFFVTQPAMTVARYGLSIMFIGFVVLVGFRHVLRARRVTVDTIASSLCIYLLLAVAWSILYSLLELMQPDSFAASFSDEVEAETMAFGGVDTVHALYYSFVTMSTLGYGDITPVSPVAQMMAAIQAVVGQFYIAVLVALLVGIYVSQSIAADRDRDESR
jgi:hypothetical protein